MPLWSGAFGASGVIIPNAFMRCYCSICRKTAGGGKYAINLAGDNRTLQVESEEHI
ncbi:MAG: hypothetical protein NHB32_14465 [Fischerella sp. CENA71]|nr:hypothetical protein [Fischerella sp. CENA71]